ncbi:hypothetical protein [Schlesneria paludicola]|uniref:hypothetical protein n=1 Tax=Schlesneria paludicola TaxID=360056 RepID=UPI00029A35B8|nr:hypothetical protein [Schlesneria paludicola]
MPRRDAISVIACLLIALVLRFGVILSQPAQLTVDRDAYIAIATSIVEGRGYSGPHSTHPTAFRPPIYPLSLAAGRILLPTPVVVAGLNLICGLVAVWFTIQVGALLHLGEWRFLAGLLIAIDPLLLQYSAQPMTESLCVVLAIGWLWSVLNENSEKPAWRVIQWIRCGAVFGILVLSRPTFWPIAAIEGLFWLMALLRTQQSVDRITRINVGLVHLGTTVVVVAPWLIRNWIVMAAPILTTTHGGYTLLLGNNPVFYREVVEKPWGTTWPDESQHQWEADLEASLVRDLGANASEVARDAWQSRQARQNMLDEPRLCLQAAFHRIRSFWNTTPQGDAAKGVNSAVLALVGWYSVFFITVALMGMGLVVARTERARWVPLYSLVVALQVVHLFYWTNTRMRAPLTPALALFAAATCSTWPTNRQRSGHGETIGI